MIDLHLHLDGSLTPHDFILLAQNQKLDNLSSALSDIKEKMIVSQNCQNLNEYLSAFKLPLSVLQTEDSIAFAVASLLKRLQEQDIWYAEIRFAPQLHTTKGCSQYEITLSAVNALKQSLASLKSIKANLILCCMRGKNNLKENLETVEIAKAFLEQGVAALDLAGAEGLYPTSDFQPVFHRACQLGVPYTIHAGEASGSDSVWNALQMGASRIGHGVQSIKDKKLMKFLADKQIPLELCFTSNCQTKAIPSPKDFPLPIFLKNHICATVNTDNMTVSDTNLKTEFMKLQNCFKLTQEQIQQLHKNAIQAAFLSNTDKTELTQKLNSLLHQKEPWFSP